MNSSTQSLQPEESPKRSTCASEDEATRAQHLADSLMAQEVLEGFRNLAQQRSAGKAQQD